MKRAEALRAYIARVDAVDRLLDQAAATKDPQRVARLIAMADIQTSIADAYARIVCALNDPTQEG